jgi:hypothetical protein
VSYVTNIAAIRAAFETSLMVLKDDVVQVSGYEIAAPTPPTIHCFPGPITYDLAGSGGLDEVMMTIQVLVPLGADFAAQDLLNGFMDALGPKSIKQAIEADSSLGGIVSDLQVLGCSGQQRFVRDNGPPLWGADWSVQVYV